MKTAPDRKLTHTDESLSQIRNNAFTFGWYFKVNDWKCCCTKGTVSSECVYLYWITYFRPWQFTDESIPYISFFKHVLFKHHISQQETESFKRSLKVTVQEYQCIFYVIKLMVCKPLCLYLTCHPAPAIKGCVHVNKCILLYMSIANSSQTISLWRY